MVASSFACDVCDSVMSTFNSQNNICCAASSQTSFVKPPVVYPPQGIRHPTKIRKHSPVKSSANRMRHIPAQEHSASCASASDIATPATPARIVSDFMANKDRPHKARQPGELAYTQVVLPNGRSPSSCLLMPMLEHLGPGKPSPIIKDMPCQNTHLYQNHCLRCEHINADLDLTDLPQQHRPLVHFHSILGQVSNQ